MTYTDWCQQHDCDHAHCPYGCEHPQPFVIDDGRLVCGRCAILGGEIVEMAPCTPATCEELAADATPPAPQEKKA